MKSVDYAMSQAKASVELEGYTISDEHQDLVKQVMTGEINGEEFNKRVIEMVKKNGPKH